MKHEEFPPVITAALAWLPSRLPGFSWEIGCWWDWFSEAVKEVANRLHHRSPLGVFGQNRLCGVWGTEWMVMVGTERCSSCSNGSHKVLAVCSWMCIPVLSSFFNNYWNTEVEVCWSNSSWFLEEATRAGVDPGSFSSRLSDGGSKAPWLSWA